MDRPDARRTHEVSVIDRAGLHEKLAKVAAGERVSDASSSADDVPNDLAFLVMLRRAPEVGRQRTSGACGDRDKGVRGGVLF